MTPLRWRRLLAQVAVLAIGWTIFLLAATLWWAGESVWTRLAGIGGQLWWATLLLFCANHLLRFIRWHWMLAAEGHAIPVPRSMSVFFAGLALLPTPGKAGVAVRSLLLLKEGVPANVSLAAYVAERLFDFLGLVILASLVFSEGSAKGRWQLGMGVGVGGVAAVLVAPAICRLIHERMPAPQALRRAVWWIDQLFVHAANMLRGHRFLVYLAIGMVANALLGVLLWLIIDRFGHSLQVADATGMVAVSHLSGSLSLMPGGLGGFDLALLAQLASRAVPGADAVVALVLTRIATLWASVAIGLPYIILGLRRLEAAPADLGESR